MKLAIVFDDLVQFGGAERLLLACHEIWPDAPIYTSYASDEWIKKCSKLHINLHTSFLQGLPYKKRLNRFFALFFLYPLAFESFDLSNYDVVLSISSRFAHGVLVKPKTKHICYINSPGRMFWESKDYFQNEFTNIPNIAKKLLLFILLLPLSVYKIWDYIAIHRADKVIANSKTPQARIKKYYKLDSDIVYPFYDFELNAAASIKDDSFLEDKKYYLVISRLLAWKKIDIAIQACVKQKVYLKIVGTGSDLVRLKKIAAGSEFIHFVGYVDDIAKYKLITKCSALIQTQYEDFGIVPVEVMACGKPVIAYGKGGVTETVLKGVTGEYFNEQSVQSLLDVMVQFNPKKYKKEDCVKQAKQFTKDAFTSNMLTIVNSVYSM